ncbi:hypothetical protein ACFX11_024661 [Malus domestica]
MDYERFIQAHRETDADITVAALPMDEKRATAFGLMKIDEEGRIIEFAEKPKGEQLKAMKVDTTILGLDDERAKEMPYIASMGIYVVSKNVMLDLLRDKFPGANDFGSEVIPGATSIGLRVQAYLYDGYWEDIGTNEAFSFLQRKLGDNKKTSSRFQSFYFHFMDSDNHYNSNNNDNNSRNNDSATIKINSHAEMGSTQPKSVFEFKDQSLVGGEKHSLDEAPRRALYSGGANDCCPHVMKNSVVDSIRIVVFSAKINLLIPFGPLAIVAIVVDKLTGHHAAGLLYWTNSWRCFECHLWKRNRIDNINLRSEKRHDSCCSTILTRLNPIEHVARAWMRILCWWTCAFTEGASVQQGHIQGHQESQRSQEVKL